jgi:outer membrane protein assembly factor BamB
LWNFTTDYFVTSSPAVSGGYVYVGSDDANVYCLNAQTGFLVWNYTTGGAVGSSPAVSGGYVYVGSDDANVYCLNAQTGAYVWGYPTGYSPTSPAVSGGYVYVGSGDSVYCLNAQTGFLVWNYTTGGYVSSPAVANGYVYVGSDDWNVYCLNAQTGAYVWGYTTGYVVGSSPAVSGGYVYVGSGDDNVYCLNATTGGLVWYYTTGEQVQSSPAVANGYVYVGSGDDNVYCLNAQTGSFVWSYTTGNYVGSSPAVANGYVYVGSVDWNVYCLNAQTGFLVWNYTTGGVVSSSPAVANGILYVGSWDNNVYAFGSAQVLPTPTLSILPSETSVTAGSSLTLSGTLSPSQSGTVTIYESINGSSFAALTMATLSSGSYSYMFSPTALGTYQFYATWPGNSQYNSANSITTITISVTGPTVTGQTYPIPGATVEASGINGTGYNTTDSLGNFLITQGLGAGFYDVDVGASGYVGVQTNATVTQGATTNMGDILLNASATITGTVLTPSGGAAAYIVVELLDQNNFTTAEAFTGSDGTFIMDSNVPTGTYSIATNVYTGQPYAPAPILTGVSAVQGQTTSVGALKLTQSGTISGTVTNSLGNGLANVTIMAYGDNGFGYATTNSSGQYSITSNLGAGSYNVTASGIIAGYIINSSYVITLSVTAGQTSTANFVLQNSGSISGTVTQANGNPAQGVYVFAYSTVGLFLGSATTYSNGTYLINSGLGTDTYSIFAGSNYLGAQTISVTAGSLTPNVNFQLGYNLAWIAGTVSNATAPLSSADLSGTFLPTGSPIALTSSNGTYLMEVDIPSGQTSVQVNVTASATGCADVSQVATATVGQTTSNVDFTLTAIVGGSLEGTVVTNTPPSLQTAVLGLSPSSSSITLESQLTLSGTLSPAQAGDVTIYESINGSAFTVLSAATLSSGSYSYKFNPSSLGSYKFYSSWPGNSQYNPAQSSTTTVSVTAVLPTTPTLTLKSSASSVSAGQTVTLSGTISPSATGTVTLSESVNGSAYQVIATPALTSGAYSYPYTIPGNGTYTFQASFPGNSQLNTAQSSVVTVSSPKPTPSNYTLYIVLIVIIVIIIIVTAYYAMAMRSKTKPAK